MRYLKILTLLSVFVLSLSACGQRGPLYMPKQEPKTNQAPKEVGEESIKEDSPVSQNMAAFNTISEMS